MTSRRSVLAALCACSVFATLPSAASATVPSRAAFELSAAGKRALATNALAVSSVPKGPAKNPSFAIGTWKVGSSAKISLTGSLRFNAGKRKLSATRLEVTIGRTSSFVSARLGTANVRLLTVTPTRPAVLDAAQQRASIIGARFALTRAAATRLKTTLKLKRTPSRATLGKLTVGVARLPTTPQALPAPAPVTPAATATPTATPTPAPSCSELFAATPAGSVDWFGCDLPGNGDLHSWTDYVQRPFPALCTDGPGTIVAGGGAARIAPDVAYDHRFTVVSSQPRPDGSATIQLQGTITYTMPAHGIDETIGALRIEIAAGGQTGTVYADGRAKPRDMGANVCTTPAQDYTDEAVLTLDLTGITPTPAGGVTRWVHIPAKIAAGTTRIGGGVYGAGSAWGAFTIPVPPGAVG
jgi:Htaa